MIFIFNGNFTMEIAMYIIKENNNTEDILPFVLFTNEDSIDELIENIGDNIPSQIIFIGKNSIYNLIAQHYQKINSEVQIIWQ